VESYSSRHVPAAEKALVNAAASSRIQHPFFDFRRRRRHIEASSRPQACLELSELQTHWVVVFYGMFTNCVTGPNPVVRTRTDTLSLRFAGRSHGVSPSSRNSANGGGCEPSIASSLLYTRRSRRRDRLWSLWSGGRPRCRPSRRCCPKTNTPSSTGKKRDTGREFTVR